MSKEIITPAFYVLDSDKQWAKKRIAELEKAILDLGPEFNVALNQSTETWHDNAPFDALRDEQALMVSEMQGLKEMLFKAAISVPKPPKGKVGFGSHVTVKSGTHTYKYKLAGHWSPHVSEKLPDGEVIISCESPIGAALLGAKLGDTVTVQTTRRQLKVVVID